MLAESPRAARRLIFFEGLADEQTTGYSPEVRERAVGLVLTSEHEHASRWTTILSIVTKMGHTPETLRLWLDKMAVDTGAKPRFSSESSKRWRGRSEHSSVPMRFCSRPLFSLRRCSTAHSDGLY